MQYYMLTALLVATRVPSIASAVQIPFTATRASPIGADLAP
jgi:hypothetical protein